MGSSLGWVASWKGCIDVHRLMEPHELQTLDFMDHLKGVESHAALSALFAAGACEIHRACPSSQSESATSFAVRTGASQT